LQELLVQNLDGVLGTCDREASALRLEGLVDFVVVAAWVGLVTEEVYLIVIFEEAEAVGLVPADRENVEADLPANRVLYPQIRELLLQSLDELSSHLMLVVILLELVPLRLRAVPADGGNVDEARPVLDEGATFDGYLDVRQVVQAEIDELVQLLLSQEVLDALESNMEY
jgi:hypothetical protein